ncbi:MAG: exocyst complex component exo84 [Vezdaea aestivalis]|nr:MAG: exocyst complex component exo84 [Vezdaea aestivalis]
MAEEKEKSKGISLRKRSKSKRLIISAPRAQVATPSVPTIKEKTDKAPEGTSQLRPKTSEKTSDLVKRRYSTRFTQLPKGIDGSTPAIPSLPTNFDQYNRPSSRDERDGSSRRGITLDTNVLRDPRLDAEKYVANVLVDASSGDIDTYRSNLRKLQSRASADLQQNVYQNRTQFIKISKEAEKLKGEMRMLRGLMSELRTNTSVMAAATDSTYESMTATARKHANRSSVANLEAMWNTQLQSLWKNVEGSQKYLPAIPGRHIVKQSGNWIELDAATWKPRRMMHLFLLNDHLLVASRKKKRVDPSANGASTKVQAVPSKLVAERCFPLQDIQLLDLAASSAAQSVGTTSRRDLSQVSDALSIRSGNESFTYRNDRDTSEKMSLLLAFRKTLEELRRALRSNPSAPAAKVVDSLNYFASRDPGLLNEPSLLDRLSDSRDQPALMIDVDGKQQNLRWVEGQMDELDMAIALQRVPEAVDLVERLRRLARNLKANNAMAQDLINFKVDERASRLADLVTSRLVDQHASKAGTMANVQALSRLGFEDRAREAFLDARSQILRKRSRQSPPTPELRTYIFHQSYITFTLLKNTLTTFTAAFPPQASSAAIAWAREHVEAFNRFLDHQLPERGTAERDECLEVARQHALVLKEVGVDFGGLVWEGGDEGSVTRSWDGGGEVGLGLQSS